RPIPAIARRAATTRIQANPRLDNLQPGTRTRRRMRGTFVANESVRRAASISGAAASTYPRTAASRRRSNTSRSLMRELRSEAIEEPIEAASDIRRRHAQHRADLGGVEACGI